MASPLHFDIPHRLGRDEAKRRILTGVPKLGRHMPGGGTVTATWIGDYRVKLEIAAMGQNAAADLTIEDTVIRAEVIVPLMLSMMAGTIAGFVKTSAEKMLSSPAAPAP